MTVIKCRMTDCKNNDGLFCHEQFLVVMKYKTCGNYEKDASGCEVHASNPRLCGSNATGGEAYKCSKCGMPLKSEGVCQDCYFEEKQNE